MQVIYTTEFDARCPVQPGITDHYEVVIEADEIIEAEELLKLLAKFQGEAMFQEDITVSIAGSFAQAGKVTTTGTHSGVKTTCTVCL